MHGNSTEDIYYIHLDQWDKLIIIICAAVFLIIVMVCLVCLLNPHCCLHPYGPCPYRNEEKAPLQPVYGLMYDPAMYPDQKGQSVKDQQGSFKRRPGSIRDSEHSDLSDFSMAEIIEMKQETTASLRRASRTSDYSSTASTFSGQIYTESRLAYGVNFDPGRGLLQVRIIQLGNFCITEPGGALAPYVKVRVYRIPKQFFSFKMKAPKQLPMTYLAAEAQTKIQRRTDNPIFNERLDFEVEDPEVGSYKLRFLVCDFDKFSRHVVLGEVTRDLTKLEIPEGNEVLFNDLLTLPQEEDLGELHVALMYLPTAEKLSVTVLNAKGLQVLELPKNSTELYVKITLMYEGRPLKKTKTTAKASDLNAVFNESFVFDVPAYQLDKVYFLFTVVEVDKERKFQIRLLGRLYIGVNFETNAKQQWLEMVQNARKQVACWHRLQN